MPYRSSCPIDYKIGTGSKESMADKCNMGYIGSLVYEFTSWGSKFKDRQKQIEGYLGVDQE